MPIAKILLPPIMGADKKMYWDEIQLSNKEFELLKSQRIVTDKTENLSEEPAPDKSKTETEPKLDPVLEFFNTASLEALSALKGIGATRAEKIKTHAPYSTLKEVQEQSELSNQGWQQTLAGLPK
jgi:hypothetical protein